MSMRLGESAEHLVDERPFFFGICRTAPRTRTILIIAGVVVVIALLATVIGLAVTHKGNTRESPPGALTCTSPECTLYSAQLLYGINKSVNPCEDFYEYACGQWLDQYSLNPPDSEQYGESTRQKDIINERIKDILLLRDGAPLTENSVLDKARRANIACVNTNDTLSVSYLRDLINNTLIGFPFAEGLKWDHRGIKTFKDLLPFFVTFSSFRQDRFLFSMNVIQDPTNHKRYIPMISQPPKVKFSNPDITNTTNFLKQANDTYFLMAQFLDESLSYDTYDNVTFQDDIDTLFQLNNDMYEAVNQSAFLITNYIPIKIKDIPNLAGFEWLRYLNDVFKDIKTYKEDDEVIVVGLDYFQKMSQRFSDSSFDEAKTIRAIVNLEVSSFLLVFVSQGNPITLKSSLIDFPGKSNVDPPGTRGSNCLNSVTEWFSYSIANKYVELYMDYDKTKELVSGMTTYIIEEYLDQIDKSSWIDDNAKTKIKTKLKNISKNYIYPDWIHDPKKVEDYYSTFTDITLNDQIENVISYSKFFVRRRYERVKDDVELTPWTVELTKVNAVYIGLGNSMFIPMAITQPSFFGKDRMSVMNFGSLGFVLGHEITHGFDYIGQIFDEHGDLVQNGKKWLDDNFGEEFYKKSQCFINQYSSYTLSFPEYINGDPVIAVFQNNGSATLNENLADNGGIRSAYLAYKRWEEENTKEEIPAVLNELTHDQLFFISYARPWCSKYGAVSFSSREKMSKEVHSPNKIRVLGSLSNLEEFSKAFSCSPGDRMVNKDPCTIW